MRLILLGPPGAGKGTQASTLSERWGVPHVSMGDLLREAIAQESEVGRQAQAALEAGELVPDEAIMGLVHQRFACEDMQSGWILDGFPRTLAQAEGLNDLLAILQQPYPKVVCFEVMTGLLIDRLMAMGRADDTVAAIRRRLAVYEEETTPLIEYYGRRLCLTMVNGSLPVGEVAAALSGLGEPETGTAAFVKDEADVDAALSGGRLLVLDCTATWCGPCKLVAPMMDRLAGDWGDRISVLKLDVEAFPSVAKRYGVKGVPTVVFVREGVLLEKMVGVKPYEIFSGEVARLLGHTGDE